MNKPTPVVTADQFVKVLEASRLLGTEQWREFRAVVHRDSKSAARFLVQKGWLTTWQGGQLLGGFHRLLVGNYRLLREIGRGRWGRVYLGEHRRLGRQGAIKLLAPQLGLQEERLRQFLEEIRLTAALEHRNLIEIYDVARDGDRYYVVMEYVSGTDLRQQVQRHGPLPLHRAADIAYQTAEVLDHLHTRGRLHGEIRPSCLMFSEAGLVKLLDAAGTASLAPLPQSVAEAGNHYAAPEQRDGRPVDLRADVYGLGRTLYFLLTGRSMPDASLVSAHDSQPGSGLDVPPEFAAVCRQMTAELPADRYGTMREVLAALRSWRREGYSPRPPVIRSPERPSNQSAALRQSGDNGKTGDAAGHVATPQAGRSLAVQPVHTPPRRGKRWRPRHAKALGMAAALTMALMIVAFWLWFARQGS